MSYLGDAFSFESFALKDLWKGIKKDPERLLVGAVDPWSTKLWNRVLGKDYEPLIDQMGGPYGGHTFSAFDNKDGGVYKRAEDAGYSTKSAGNLHDAAHVIGAVFGGQGLYGAGQNILGSGASGAGAGGTDLGFFANGGKGGITGLGGGNAGAAAQAGVIPGGAGMGSATPTASGLGSLGWQDYMKMGQGMAGGQGGQQQRPPPQYIPPQKRSFGQRMMGGLGRARDGLTPVDPRMASQMDPEYLKQMRNQAMLKMGLGMMAASNQGGRFGESVAAGLGQAQGAFNKDIEGTYQRGVKEREEKREIDREAELDKRFFDERGYKRERDSLDDKQWQKTFDANQQYRKDSLASLEKRAAAKVPGVTMSDKAVEFAAQRLLNGEPANKVLANFGRGAQGAQNITAVQNRLAELASEGNVSPQLMAVLTQELAADSRTRLELGAREGKVASRVEEAKLFAKIAGEASKTVPRGQFVPLNKLLQMADTQISDPKLAAFKAANVSLINAYAAAVGGGVPTVHDKEAAEKMLASATSDEAYQAVVNQLITEMDAALAAPRNVMDQMRIHDTSGGLGHPAAPSPPASTGGWSIKPKP